MKRIIVCILMISVVISFIGCKTKEKLEANLTEKILEEAFDGNIDIDGDKVTVKGENDEEITFGDYKWPSSELAKIVPEFKNGKVNSVMEGSEVVVITLDSVKEEHAAAYIEEVKVDFAGDAYEVSGEDFISFNGINASGIRASFTYMNGILSISIESSGE